MEEELSNPFNHDAYDGDGPYPSWFWYGRYEGAIGGYIPPQVPGAWPQISYWLGNIIGRRFGPPRPRTEVEAIEQFDENDVNDAHARGEHIMGVTK